MDASTQVIKKMNKTGMEKSRSYGQIIQLLDSLRPYDYTPEVIKRMKKLDLLLDNVSTKKDIILVGGATGKSLSIHFATKLLKDEGFNAGVAYSSHFLNYNERFILDNQQISNKDFTDALNTVLDVAIENAIDSTAFEILTMASLVYFASQNIDLIIMEVGVGGRYDATNFCNPIISSVTRIAQDNAELLGNDLDEISKEMLEIVRPNAWFISAEQSKLRLQKMKQIVEEKGGKWSMPIRKLANLPYIYEQLYGRTVSLGERIAQIYVENIKQKFSPLLRGNLLATQKGQRGRPTLEAKRNAEINPIKTLKSFWTSQFNLLKGRFEILDKEKPTILLDCAHNMDGFENLFLGLRLLHYQKPLKDFALIIGVDRNIDELELLKLIRYFSKKISGYVYFVPLKDRQSKDVNDLEQKAKALDIKAKGYSSFEVAFEAAKSVVDQRDGLLCVTGSMGIVSQYWENRGIKKI
ncbi:hypothetical protein KJ644_02760 [Candidatus Dependentiae bacterium]|nr:hypothetical protein [Candidatus Dependentiae bacterium]MBU4387370.1 hypothetical protein [Candidatus Dependentiae bacterium]MCG2756572.1 hypothetical protein [Candidatus Dependentiae bacterium]